MIECSSDWNDFAHSEEVQVISSGHQRAAPLPGRNVYSLVDRRKFRFLQKVIEVTLQLFRPGKCQVIHGQMGVSENVV